MGARAWDWLWLTPHSPVERRALRRIGRSRARSRLDRRQRRILSLLGACRTDEDIADELGESLDKAHHEIEIVREVLERESEKLREQDERYRRLRKYGTRAA